MVQVDNGDIECIIDVSYTSFDVANFKVIRGGPPFIRLNMLKTIVEHGQGSTEE